MNKVHCFGCNIEKDYDVLEVSPWADEDGLTTDPIEPFLLLDCQGPTIPDEPEFSEYKHAIVCHACFHALSPDMWISKDCWESIQPCIPYNRLPLYIDGEQYIPEIKPLP